MEFRHAFNVTGYAGTLPEDEVHGFRSAVEELARDFKQLASMLLTVIILDLLYFILSLLLINNIFSNIFYYILLFRVHISLLIMNLTFLEIHSIILSFPGNTPLLHRYLSIFSALKEDPFHALDL